MQLNCINDQLKSRICTYCGAVLFLGHWNSFEHSILWILKFSGVCKYYHFIYYTIVVHLILYIYCAFKHNCQMFNQLVIIYFVSGILMSQETCLVFKHFFLRIVDSSVLDVRIFMLYKCLEGK